MTALLSAVIPDIVDKVLDRVLPDPAARERANQELLRLTQEGELAETRTQLSAILAEAQSADRWTARARPAFLYVMYVVILLCFGGGVAGIWWPAQVATAAQNIANLLAAIPDSLWWLFGTGYLGYTGARSLEKLKAKG